MSEERKAPKDSHHWWDAGFLGARPDYFPRAIGEAVMALLEHSQPCAVESDGERCFVPTLVSYDGRPTCLGHAVVAESEAAGRSEKDLAPD